MGFAAYALNPEVAQHAFWQDEAEQGSDPRFLAVTEEEIEETKWAKNMTPEEKKIWVEKEMEKVAEITLTPKEKKEFKNWMEVNKRKLEKLSLAQKINAFFEANAEKTTTKRKNSVKAKTPEEVEPEKKKAKDSKTPEEVESSEMAKKVAEVPTKRGRGRPVKKTEEPPVKKLRTETPFEVDYDEDEQKTIKEVEEFSKQSFTKFKRNPSQWMKLVEKHLAKDEKEHEQYLRKGCHKNFNPESDKWIKRCDPIVGDFFLNNYHLFVEENQRWIDTHFNLFWVTFLAGSNFDPTKNTEFTTDKLNEIYVCALQGLRPKAQELLQQLNPSFKGYSFLGCDKDSHVWKLGEEKSNTGLYLHKP